MLSRRGRGGCKCLTLRSRRGFAAGTLRGASAARAPHLHVSALHYFVMQSFSPISPLLLSFTAGGFSCTLPTRPLAVSSWSVVHALVLAYRASFAHASSRFAVGASLLAFGRACVSGCLPFIRLGRWARLLPFSAGRQPSCYGCRSLTLSLSGRSNPPLNPVRFALWTLRDVAAQRRLALR